MSSFKRLALLLWAMAIPVTGALAQSSPNFQPNTPLAASSLNIFGISKVDTTNGAAVGLTVSGGHITGTPIAGSTGAFTTLSVTGAISGTNMILGSNATAGSGVINGSSSQTRGFTIQTGGLSSWNFGARSNGTNDFAIGRFDPTTGSFTDLPFSISSSTGITSINQLTSQGFVTWSPLVAKQGVWINNVYSNATQQSGGDTQYNSINSNDLINYSGGFIFTLAVNGQSGSAGNRAALMGQIAINTTPANGVGTYIGGVFSPFATANSGGAPGSITSYKGEIFGAWAKPRLSANNWNNYFGQEIDANVTNNAAVAGRTALLIQDQSTPNGARGIYADYGLSFGRLTGPTNTAADTAPGFLSVMAFGGNTNDFPTTSEGTLIKVQPRIYGIPAFPTLASYTYGIDARASSITAGGALWAGPNSAADPAGNIYGASLTTTSVVQAQTATLTSVTVTNGGAFLVSPLWQVQDPPSGGTTATLSTATMGITAELGDAVLGTFAAGSGYTAGDVLTLTGTGGGKVNVATVTGGVPTGYTLNTVGSIAVGSMPGTAFVTASIAGTTMTVSAVTSGNVAVGEMVTGSSFLPAGTFITALGTGTGGIGTYTINNSLTLTSRSLIMASSVAVTGGTGTGLKIVPGWQVLTLTVSNAGSGYAANPTPLIFSGATNYKLPIVAAGMTPAAATLALNPNGGAVKFGSGAFSANASVVTTMTSLGPTGSHTTIQEWLTVTNASGVARYIPAY